MAERWRSAPLHQRIFHCCAVSEPIHARPLSHARVGGAGGPLNDLMLMRFGVRGIALGALCRIGHQAWRRVVSADDRRCRTYQGTRGDPSHSPNPSTLRKVLPLARAWERGIPGDGVRGHGGYILRNH